MEYVFLRPGDELIERGFFDHKMVYVGPIGPYGEDVLNPANGQPARFVHHHPLDWRRIQVGQRGPEDRMEQLRVQARARDVVRNRVVNKVFGPNCEHISSYVRTGKPESPQLRFYGGVATIALILIGLGGIRK